MYRKQYICSNLADCRSLDENYIFHIMKVLVANVKCLSKYKDCIPKHIRHAHLDEVSRKTDFAILDLLDKSENKADEMITIMEHIHEKYISHTDEEHPKLIQRKVFGGDVLTNERAYTAQLAMVNHGESDFDRMTGVIHRPEGLHRMMNLFLVFLSKYHSSVQACCFVPRSLLDILYLL